MKRLAGGTDFQVIMEAQNNDEDAIVQQLYTQGSIIAMGETGAGHRQLILSTSPEWKVVGDDMAEEITDEARGLARRG